MNINERLEKLRNLMKERNIDAYIVPTSDPHQSEYLSDFYRTREFISGFTGSYGTALITMDEALLWTDSRYFLQAAKELKHSEFKLMKMGMEGVPNLIEYLDENIGEFGKIAFDGKNFSVKAYKDLSESMGARILVSDVDYISQIWTDRPSLRKDKAWIMEDKYAGESISEKILRLRNIMADNDYDYTFIGSPEDICYLLNIRGNDIDYNPVLLSYSLISKNEAYLCIDEDKIPGEVSDFAKSEGAEVSVVSAKIEQEISEIEDEEERAEFLAMIGLEESGTDKVIKDSYKTLNLMSFLTTGEMETRAWTITNGTKAVDAAGKIHSDISRGFIKAEIVSYDDLVESGSIHKAQEKGLLRQEGKDYIMQDGDVVNFKFNV